MLWLITEMERTYADVCPREGGEVQTREFGERTNVKVLSYCGCKVTRSVNEVGGKDVWTLVLLKLGTSNAERSARVVV